jgi:hypothetical protein
MYGTITGAVSNPNNMAITPNETFYFGNVDNQFQIGAEGNTDTEITFANDLTDSTLTKASTLKIIKEKHKSIDIMNLFLVTLFNSYLINLKKSFILSFLCIIL